MQHKISLAILAVAGMVGCTTPKAPDVAGNIRNSLRQGGLNDVTVSQDRDKGVVTLGGQVAAASEKDRAEQIARSLSGNQVVANQISVLPSGAERTAQSVESDIDKGIENNLDAALTQARIPGVSHETKNGVVTLKGNLRSAALRAEAARVASQVPNVQQVINEIEVNSRATSSGGNADRSR